MDKNQLLTELLITARDAIEDALDELNPPPLEEALEASLSEAPPKRGVAVPRKVTVVPRAARGVQFGRKTSRGEKPTRNE